MVQVVAVFTAIAFAGVAFIVLAFVALGGGDNTQGPGSNSALVAEAQEEVDANPQDADAWEDLALAQATDGNFAEALASGEKAAELDPGDFRRVETLVSLHTQNGNPDGAISALETYTQDNPDNPDAFLQLGNLAQRAGRDTLARLSFERFLVLAPDDRNADGVRQQIANIESGVAVPDIEVPEGADDSGN